MRHRFAVLTATAAIAIGGVAAGSASAAEPAAATATSRHATVAPQAKQGGRCVAAGVRTLIDLDLIVPAARRQIDYSTLADPVDGPIFTTLPPGSFLSLSEVIRLHVTNPELFAWCR